MTATLRERRMEHAAEDVVRLERSMDARSARMECGFWDLLNGDLFVKCQGTYYDI